MLKNLGNFIKRVPINFGYQSSIVARCSTNIFQTNSTHQECVQNTQYPMLGQPTPMSHPHLMKNGEIIPGIRIDEFKHRRSKLMENIVLSNYSKYSYKPQIVIIPSSSKVYMSDKIPYVFRQNTDFLYFSGCQEPDSILVITSVSNDFTSILFVNKKDEHTELWEGPKTGIDAAPLFFGVNKALPVTEFEKFFISFINEHKNSVIWYEKTSEVQPILNKKLCEITQSYNDQVFVSPKTIIHQIRSIKSQYEIDLMQKSCNIASQAIKKTIQDSKPDMSEHQLFAIVDYECRMNGAEFLAYPPVVAAGKNANIIHYIANNQIIRSGDMVLMDAGCEYHGYSSDITRTWPINGTFSPEQRILYEIILDVQNTLIEKLKEMPTLDQLFHHMCFLLGCRLQTIGLIPKDLVGDKLISAAYSYCPHHVSHYLGMDIHDTGKVSTSVPLKSGMVITVEPGIYVNPKNKLAPSNFHNLGIRIEDNILITKDDPVILTKNCPKEIADIEAIASINQPTC